MAKIKIAQWLAKERKIGTIIDCTVKRETQKAVLVDGHMYVGAGSHCAICGRFLTNPISINVGIGPVCCENYGIPRPESLSDEELQAQLKVKTTFKDLWLPKSQIEVLEGDLTPTVPQEKKEKKERWLRVHSSSELRLKVDFHERETAKSIYGYKGWDSALSAWKLVNDPFVIAQITSIWPEFAQQEQRTVEDITPFIDERLYTFQKKGVASMASSPAFLLADDMGTGKTPQLIQTTKVQNLDRILVVCLASLKWNWANECKKWWPEATIQIVDGDTPEKRAEQLTSGATFTIANYESFFYSVEADKKLREKTGQKRMKAFLPGFEKMHWDVLILDEAHKVKNRKSNNNMAMRKVRRQCDRCYLSTGSPVLNSAQDLWALLNILFPKVFSSFWKFVEEFCIVEHNGYGMEIVDIVDIEDPRIQKLRKLIEPIFLRRTKEEVFCDMPKKIITRVPIRLSPGQEKSYLDMEERMLTEIGGEVIFAPIAMAQIVRLKQICIDPTLMIEDCQEPLSGPKVDAALDIIDSLGERKAVVFTQWSRVANRFAKTLSNCGISSGTITGAVKDKERQNLVDEFQAGKGPQVLVCTIEAGGTGINLFAASTAIFFDKVWTPKINEQAQDRLYRHGQKETVNIYELIAKDTVEEAIEGVNIRKTKISEILIEKRVA